MSEQILSIAEAQEVFMSLPDQFEQGLEISLLPLFFLAFLCVLNQSHEQL